MKLKILIEKIKSDIIEFKDDDADQKIVAIDLKGWIFQLEEEASGNRLGIRTDKFFIKFVNQYLEPILKYEIPELL